MSNALTHARSPYLRAHADNPVNWQPWGDGALQQARREDRPLFVSVGYSACHWCHVMAHEAFSDARVAALLNDNFVSIKVDREEQPDVDRVLQVAHQVLTGRGGGWPLSVFMTPDTLTPFFAGTYFPLEARYGMPGFATVLERVLDAWRNKRDQVNEQSEQLRGYLVAQFEGDAGADKPGISRGPIAAALRQWQGEFDAAHGGFGSGPRFPQPPLLAHLLTSGERTMVGATLNAMASGGLRDHVGGGFFRYTVDDAWRVPHFEKMLGDNAQLIGVYAEAGIRLNEPSFAAVAREIAQFLETEMTLPEGGCATSLDADAAGVEGGFYTWDQAEVESALGPEHYPAFAHAWGLDGAPPADGRWHLARMGGTGTDFTTELAQLHEARAGRTHPARDDKRLTRLNALVVTSLARASLWLDDSGLGERASALLALLAASAVHGDRVDAAAWQGVGYGRGLLADYAGLADAALAVAGVSDEPQPLALAVKLAEVLLARFRAADGAFTVVPGDDDALLYRARAWDDDALPAAGAVAVDVLTRLGHLLGEPRYLDAAEQALRSAQAQVEHAPGAHPTLLGALDRFTQPVPLVVLCGRGDLSAWAVAAQRACPSASVYRVGADVCVDALRRFASRDKVTAYVCHGLSCSAPVTQQADLLRVLAEPGRARE